MNFLMGCMLLDSSPITCTTTPSFRVAWASTCLILVWQSRKLRAITLLWISCRRKKTTRAVSGSDHRFSPFHVLGHRVCVCVHVCKVTHGLSINSLHWFAVAVQATVDVGGVLPIKPLTQVDEFRDENLEKQRCFHTEPTCAGSREPGSGGCNTVGQTLARPAGHLASPSPFLWSTGNLWRGIEKCDSTTNN